jgi:hypothetical protein
MVAGEIIAFCSFRLIASKTIDSRAVMVVAFVCFRAEVILILGGRGAEYDELTPS